MKKLIIFLLFSICLYSQNQPRGQNIVAGEYFINNDPGEGSGTPLSSTYGFYTADVNIPSIPINNVAYVRFKSSNGKWGPPRSIKNIYPIPASGSVIQAGEYFINTDPGLGAATKFNFNYNDSVSISSIKANRDDKIFLRANDSFGRWSDAVCVYYRWKTLIGAQYKLKLTNGNLTVWQNLNMQNQGFPSCFYSAESNSINNQNNNIDTIFLQFQSEDFIWGTVSKYAYIDIIGDIKKLDSNIPKEFKLSNAYPNPFNPTTKIRFDIPRTSQVNLTVYDILGREVEILVDKAMMPGSYEVTFNGNHFASGVYFYGIHAGNFVQAKKLILMK
ncbi:MAG: T9SS type A sorting domain-containing protein [Ignavibacteriaceae bacterium]